MSNENLKQFAEAYNTFRKTITKEEFIEAFKALQLAVRKIADLNADKRAELERILTTLAEKVRGESGETLENVKRECKKQLATLKATIEDKLDEVKDGAPGIDGKDADNELIISTLTERLPTAEKLALEVVGNGEAVRDGLELLQGNERLDKKAIKGLDEEFEKVNNRFDGVSKAIGGINIGALKRHLLNIDVSSQCNGDTRTFTIPSNFGIFGVFSTQDPKIFRPTIDYTVGNQTVILDSGIPPIQSGQTLIIQIFK